MHVCSLLGTSAHTRTRKDFCEKVFITGARARRLPRARRVARLLPLHLRGRPIYHRIRLRCHCIYTTHFSSPYVEKFVTHIPFELEPESLIIYVPLLYCVGRQVRDVHAAEAGASPENFRREDDMSIDK